MPVFDQGSIFNSDPGMGKTLKQCFVVSCDDDCRSDLVKLFKQVHQADCNLAIDVPGGFVRQQNLGPGNYRPCDRDALLFSA